MLVPSLKIDLLNFFETRTIAQLLMLWHQLFDALLKTDYEVVPMLLSNQALARREL